MNLKDKVIRFFLAPFPIRHVRIRKSITTRDIVRKYSRGNWRMQLGRVMTKSDVEKLRRKALKYEF